VARERGRLAELGRRMGAIQRRAGLREGQSWSLGQGPADYQRLCHESGELCGKVRDTVFTTVLRRYGLDVIADLFEDHRDRYDRRFERGRKRNFEPQRQG